MLLSSESWAGFSCPTLTGNLFYLCIFVLFNCLLPSGFLLYISECRFLQLKTLGKERRTQSSTPLTQETQCPPQLPDRRQSQRLVFATSWPCPEATRAQKTPSPQSSMKGTGVGDATWFSEPCLCVLLLFPPEEWEMKLRSCRSVLRVKYDVFQKQWSGHSTLQVSGTIFFSEGATVSGSRWVTEHKIPHTILLASSSPAATFL